MTTSVVKALLGVTVSTYDDRIDLALASAKRRADDYCNNPFVEMVATDPSFDSYYQARSPLNDRSSGVPALDADPAVEMAIPSTVEEGILEYVRWTLQAQGIPLGVKSEKVGDISRSYLTALDVFGDISRTYWRPFRLCVGF
jgi:hypothetical protein